MGGGGGHGEAAGQQVSKAVVEQVNEAVVRRVSAVPGSGKMNT
jgi:nanoRNase/pAp phosphatase (c-di-AMP/oligoRNAs hydrolase)